MSDLKQAALEYHAKPKPGKLSIAITKPTKTQRDLSLAYSPGVAEPVREIFADENNVYKYTAKANLVGVISDGSAVLGLGNVGPLASKPVMEGKAVLFKRLADVDVFDIEVNAESPQAFIETVANISPTFGGINLEDIKAPKCFEIEESLIERLDIPVFHDDQHGTAIIIAAALLNALELQGKSLKEAKIVCVGAGAAGIASMRLLLALGAQRDNLLMLDSKGVIHLGRDDLNSYKFAFAIETEKRTLDDAIKDADVFIGVSGPNILSKDHLLNMAAKPIVFALSNPDPEVDPKIASTVRDDLILATGRSDYPNQVNNVLCFPYIFRGALDVRATKINREMMIAAIFAIKDLVHEAGTDEHGNAYPDCCPTYIIPSPMDPRLMEKVSSSVAYAAVKTKVAKLDYPSHYPKIEDNT